MLDFYTKNLQVTGTKGNIELTQLLEPAINAENLFSLTVDATVSIILKITDKGIVKLKTLENIQTLAASYINDKSLIFMFLPAGNVSLLLVLAIKIQIYGNITAN